MVGSIGDYFMGRTSTRILFDDMADLPSPHPQTHQTFVFIPGAPAENGGTGTAPEEGAALAPVQRQVNDVQFDCLSAAEFKQLSKMIDRLIDSSNRALRLQAYFEDKSGGPTPERSDTVRKERSSAQA